MTKVQYLVQLLRRSVTNTTILVFVQALYLSKRRLKRNAMILSIPTIFKLNILSTTIVH